MAAGWSPVGSNGATRRKSGIVAMVVDRRELERMFDASSRRRRGGRVTCGWDRWGRRGYPRRPSRGRASRCTASTAGLPVRAAGPRTCFALRSGGHPRSSVARERAGTALEFRDDNRRGKFIIVIGLVLAVVAGGAAFYLVNQANQQAGQASLPKVPIVVAVRAIPARQAIVAEDVAVREVPLDPTNENGIVTDPAQVVGRIPAVTILQNQPVTQNLLASSQA